jgi:phosphoribosylformylglycinamidine synthase
LTQFLWENRFTLFLELLRANYSNRNLSSMIKARITVTLKNGVLDPQGKAIEHALSGLGFGGVGQVRQGKVFDLELSETDKAKAEADLKAMCDKLLANTVIENYSVTLA